MTWRCFGGRRFQRSYAVSATPMGPARRMSFGMAPCCQKGLKFLVRAADTRSGERMGSFKLKLVSYFVVLALLPLGAAFWGFHAVLSRSATERVDARHEAGLRAALTAYQDEAPANGARAGDPSFVRPRAATVSVNGHLVGEVLVTMPLDAPLLHKLE